MIKLYFKQFSIFQLFSWIKVKVLISFVWLDLTTSVLTNVYLNYLSFQSFDFESTWWWLFQKRVVRTEFDIYVCIYYTVAPVVTKSKGRCYYSGVLSSIYGFRLPLWYLQTLLLIFRLCGKLNWKLFQINIVFTLKYPYKLLIQVRDNQIYKIPDPDSEVFFMSVLAAIISLSFILSCIQSSIRFARSFRVFKCTTLLSRPNIFA